MSLRENRKQDKGKTQKMWFYFMASQEAEEEDVERIRKFAQNADERGLVRELSGKEADPPKRCIYVTTRSCGVSSMDLAPVLEKTGVSSWLIVICGVESRGSLNSFSVLRNTWEQKIGLLKASVSVIADDENCKDAIWKWMQSECDMGEHGRICLLASSRKQVGRSSLRKCLEEIPESKDWQFEERLLQDKDYCSIRDAAARVVFIGSELDDFVIPFYDGGFRKSIFFLNKCDTQPICFKDSAGACQSIREILRKEGWDLSDGQSGRIYIGSTLYSSFYVDLKSSSLSPSDFFVQRDFAMWDEYLLPASRETYSDEQVKEFLQKCDCITDMAKYLFSEKNG